MLAHRNHRHRVIDTLEGQMIARKGDWIVKGIKGELYPVEPDIFKETYEKVVELKNKYPHKCVLCKKTKSEKTMNHYFINGGRIHICNQCAGQVCSIFKVIRDNIQKK